MLRLSLGYFQQYIPDLSGSDGSWATCYGISLNPDIHPLQNCSRDDLLIKSHGFLWLLNFTVFSRIPLGVVFAALFIIAAFLTIYFFWLNFKKIPRSLLATIFFMVAFFPAGYYSEDIYRNQVLFSIPFITILLSLILAIRSVRTGRDKIWGLLILSIVTGVFIFWSASLKETGSYVYIFNLAVIVGAVIYRIFCEKHLKTLLYTLPTLIVIATILLCSVLYQNYVYSLTGSRIVNTRTSGGSEEVVNDIYKIKSDQHSLYVWAPFTSIEKAFNNSITLNSIKGYREKVMKCAQGFASPHDPNGPVADFMTWCLRWNFPGAPGPSLDEVKYNKFMTAAANDLRKAFANGKLQKDNEFQPISQIGPRSIKNTLKTMLVYKNDIISDILFLNMQNDSDKEVNYYISEKYRSYYHLASQQDIQRMAPYLLYIYGWANAMWLFFGPVVIIGGIIVILIEIFKNKRFDAYVLGAIMLFGAFLLVQFGVTWFSIALINIGQYGAASPIQYRVEALPYLIMFMVFSAMVAINRFSSKIKR